MQKDETENKINGEACGRESEVIFNPLFRQDGMYTVQCGL